MYGVIAFVLFNIRKCVSVCVHMCMCVCKDTLQMLMGNSDFLLHILLFSLFKNYLLITSLLFFKHELKKKIQKSDVYSDLLSQGL